MPHSTFFSTPPPPIPDAKSLPPGRLPTATTTPTTPTTPTRSSHVDVFPASFKFSPRTPLKAPSPSSSPLLANRFFLNRGHGRSKSESATMNFPQMSNFPPPFSPPSPVLTPRRRARGEFAPPLLRSNSLPLVIPEGRRSPSPSLSRTPATPTTPPAHRGVFGSNIPRCASPTRVYASSLSPAGIRSGYYPGSSFSPRTPSPPSYLVNETIYPGSASSSSPSTPTSLRSRSPSISSLETIPDTPDAEQAAVEAEIKEAMERKMAKIENEEEEDGGFGRRRRSLDFDRGGAIRWGTADKRKRWSVCGGEKRGDLDLETIWEEALNNAAEANHSMIHRDEEDKDKDSEGGEEGDEGEDSGDEEENNVDEEEEDGDADEEDNDLDDEDDEHEDDDITREEH